MEFFPLTLGVPKPRTGHEKERKPDAPRLTYEAWREGLSGPEEVAAHPAADVLSRLMRGDPTLPTLPWVVLGEPGAGKTSLLEHWHATWLRALPRPYLGMRTPVLVRLRDVPREVFVDDPAAVADSLWANGLAAGQGEAKGATAAAVFTLPPRVFTPIWLLDGLDELTAPPIADSRLWDLLRALPGEVVLTCRTAVFQPARAEVAGRVGKEWHILGLKPEKEQAEFLARAYAAEGIDPAHAEEVVRALNANVALRPLAAVPLLLRLVAESGPRPTFPLTRAKFYENVTNALWERRLRGRPELFDLVPERDAALAALAAAMDLTVLDAGPEELRRARVAPELREALRRSGILHFDDRHIRVSFPHLTFQEFHLARAWLGRPFGEVLREHTAVGDPRWADPRYEETLALLVALHVEQGRASMVEAELRGFVAKARADHARDPRRLRSLGRSPLRTVLHLLARAAVSLEVASPVLPRAEHVLVRLAIASDRRAPPAALAELAGDNDPEVRRGVAENATTPAAALAELARDDDLEVRQLAAWNAAMPPTVLAGLARDDDPGVRSGMARNAATPAAALAELAGNAATPAAMLAELAGHGDPWVRQIVGLNPATPAALLTKLADDDHPMVRQMVAGNAATPAKVLAELARGDDPVVRQLVAGNAATPAKVLAELARGDDPVVRQLVAGNAATPAAMLAELARGDDPVVRQMLGWNFATPPVVLAELAGDDYPEVRRGVARNAATPTAALAELAGDGDWEVRQGVAKNATLLLEDLPVGERPAML